MSITNSKIKLITIKQISIKKVAHSVSFKLIILIRAQKK